jgi:Cu/Ag efflux protein CusF
MMGSMNIKKLILAAPVIALLAGCGDRQSEQTSTTVQPPAATNAAELTPPGAKSFLVRGVVKKVEPERNNIVIQHEEIPDYMPAMTMPFKVKDGKLLAGVQPGDTIWFWLWATEEELWIEQITREKPGEPAPQPGN